jgi:hypothetical protein
VTQTLDVSTPSKIRTRGKAEVHDPLSDANTPEKYTDLLIKSEAIDISEGQIVWAKLKGFAAWPAKVSKPQTAAQVMDTLFPCQIQTNVLFSYRNELIRKKKLPAPERTQEWCFSSEEGNIRLFK